MGRRVQISAAEARRIALAAQGFDRERPANSNDARHFRRAMKSINVLQLDFVNVLMPAHFLMIWSRLGAYDRGRFERFLYDSGEHIEQWAHEASIVASSDWPLLAHRRERYSQWKNSPVHKMANKDEYLNGILEFVKNNGPTSSDQLPQVEGPKRKAGDWHRSVARWGLEHHFGTGDLAVRRRKKNFQRVYDMPTRILPARQLDTSIAEIDANRALIRKAAASLGIATCHDIADYYRMNIGDTAPRLEELVETSELHQVSVEGWTAPGYLATSARAPREIPGSSLLSPFDPVVWFRPRAERIFGFDYRIEIYVPAAKRRWGYYVLPFRQGDTITARVDLKADRHQSVLCVQNAHLERHAVGDETATELALELQSLADWMRLENINIKKASAFEKALARCC